MSDAEKVQSQFEDAESASETQETEEAVIQVDGFRVKAKIRPVATNEAKPKTWKEVWAGVDGNLKGIVAGVFSLTYEVIDASRCLVRGLSAIPQAIADRIRGGHEEADDLEGRRQAALIEQSQPPMTPEEAREQFVDIIRELRAEGIAVEASKLPNGKWVFAVVRPEARGLSLEIERSALPGSSDEAPEEGVGDSS